MRIVFLALPALLMLSGCGLVGMIASGVSDGTKYVINRVERDPEIQARSQKGYGPAGGDNSAAVPQEQTYPSQTYPQQSYPDQSYPPDISIQLSSIRRIRAAAPRARRLP